MKKILCYGDSNTYGYDAASPFGECLPFKVTWIGRFFDDPVFKDYLFINQGQNGRCIPRKDWEFQDLEDACAARADIVLGTVMLGSNDLCMDPRISMEDMAAAMEALIRRMLTFPCFREDPRKLLLIAPTPTELGRYGSLGEKCDKKWLFWHRCGSITSTFPYADREKPPLRILRFGNGIFRSEQYSMTM